jgi:hypothetical protein
MRLIQPLSAVTLMRAAQPTSLCPVPILQACGLHIQTGTMASFFMEGL